MHTYTHTHTPKCLKVQLKSTEQVTVAAWTLCVKVCSWAVKPFKEILQSNYMKNI